MKRAKKLLTVFALCLFATFMAAAPASAAKKPSCAKSVKGYYEKWYEIPGKKGHYTTRISCYGMTAKNRKAFSGVLTINNLSKSAKISNVKSNNPQVFASYIKGSGISIYPDATAKGVYTGSSKISFTISQDGKTYNLSCSYKSAKAPTPFKNLIVNGKNHASSLTGVTGINVKTGKTATIKFTAKSKVKNVKITYMDSKGKEKTVKNGAKLTIPKNGLALIVNYQWKGSSYTADMNADYCQIYLSR